MTEAQATKKCPHCGGEILAAATKCKHCKAQIGSTTGTPLAVVPADATKTCPRCGGEVLAAAVKCKHCKAPLLEYEPVTGDTERSPQRPGKQRSSAARLVVIVAVTLVVAAGLLAGGFHFVTEKVPDHGANIKKSWAEQAAKQAKELDDNMLNQVMNAIDEAPDERNCELYELEHRVPQAPCVALTLAIKKGRLTEQHRAVLRVFSGETKVAGLNDHISAVFAAPAGSRTSEAARAALKILVKVNMRGGKQ